MRAHCPKYPEYTLFCRDRRLQFCGHFLTVTDPVEIAAIRAHPDFGRLFTEVHDHAPAPPSPPVNPALWKIDVPKPLPAVPRQERSPLYEPPPRSAPDGPSVSSRLHPLYNPPDFASRATTATSRRYWYICSPQAQYRRGFHRDNEIPI
jgi:hypothetical protein